MDAKILITLSTAASLDCPILTLRESPPLVFGINDYLLALCAAEH